MQPTSRKVLVITALMSCVVSIHVVARATPRPDPQGNAASASQHDKIKSCNDLADNKGLKGDDRKNFLQSCISKTTNAQPLSEVSQRDKLNACKNVADKRNLKGEDRRSFIKDCMNKVNSK